MSEGWLFRLGGLGDLLLALPSIRLVRRAFPEVRLLLVGRREYASVLKEAGIVDEVASADEARWAPFFSAVPGEAAAGMGHPSGLAGRDKVSLAFLWFHGGSSPALDRNLRAVFPEAAVGTFKADPSARLPLDRIFFDATARFLRGQGFGDIPFEECAGLPIGAEIKRRGRALLGGAAAGKRFAVVHPGSGSPRKCWPLDRFLEIVSFLASEKLAGAVVTGEAEAPWEEDIERAGLPPGWIWLCRPLLSDLAGLLASGAFYVGNDSGITHLAAVCGARVTAIFRDEHAAAWRPLGDVRVLSASEVASIPVEKVRRALIGFISGAISIENPAKKG